MSGRAFSIGLSCVMFLASGCGRGDTKPTPSASTASSGASKPASSASAKPAATASVPPAASVKPEVDWKNYVSKDGKYSVDLPGTAKEKSDKIDTVAGKVTMFSTVGSNSGGAFTVQYYDLPGKVDTKKYFDAGIDGLVKTYPGSKKVEEKDVQLDGSPGKSVVVDVPAIKGTLRARLFLVGNRGYQLMTVGPSTSPASDSTKFFDSFKITK